MVACGRTPQRMSHSGRHMQGRCCCAGLQYPVSLPSRHDCNCSTGNVAARLCLEEGGRGFGSETHLPKENLGPQVG